MKVHRLHTDVLILQRNETHRSEESVKKVVKKTNKKVTAKKDETQEVKAEEEV